MDISKINLKNTSYDIKDSYARGALAEMSIANEAAVRAIVTERLPSGSTVTTSEIVAVESGTTSLTAQFGKCYNIGGTVNTFTVILPAVNGSRITGFVINMTTGSTPNITITPTADELTNTTPNVLYADTLSIDANNTYELNFLWNGAAWIVAGIKVVE